MTVEALTIIMRFPAAFVWYSCTTSLQIQPSLPSAPLPLCKGCQIRGGQPPTALRHLAARARTHGRLDGAGSGEDRPEGGGDLRLAAQGVGQHRPHPRRRGDLQGVDPGAGDRPHRHLLAAAAQHRPRGRRRVPGGRRGVPRQGPRRGLLPVRVARVQLLHLGPDEERAGLGVAPAQLLGRQGRGDPQRVGRVRRRPVAVPHPAGRRVPRPPLRQQARGIHQGAPAAEEVRRRRQPGRSGDEGAGQEGAPGAAGSRAQAPAGEACCGL